MRNISDTIARLSAFQPGMTGLTPTASNLVAIDAFGSNPGALAGWIHVPAGLSPNAPLVVALHGCTQTAAGYDQGTGWTTLADRAGFAVLFPEQRRGNNANLCFNWFESTDIARRGGEAESIAQMVEATIAAHGIDRDRIFVTGLSAGGAMATVMLATYPDLFAAGAVIGGLPYGGARGVSQALDRMRGHGAVADDAAGAAVLDLADTGRDRWPAIAIWHGTQDTTVVPANLQRLTGQWRAVHGLPAAPTSVERGANWERQVWLDADGRAAVESWTVTAMGHGVPIDPSGPAALGRSGPYMLDVGVASTQLIAVSWGLAAEADMIEASADAGSPPVRPRRLEPSAPEPVGGVQQVIEQALRTAGLMR